MAKATFTYNGRGLQASQVVTLSSGNTATTSTTYFLDGLPQKRTDPRTYDWLSYYQSCCGRIQGNKDPAGHGSFSNSDYLGRGSHSVVVADYDTHVDTHNPIDAKTLGRPSFTGPGVLGRLQTTPMSRPSLKPPDLPIDPAKASSIERPNVSSSGRER